MGFPGRARVLGMGVRAITVLVARTLFVLAVLGVVVAGCAEVSPQPLSAAASAGELENRTLDDPRLMIFVRASRAGGAEAGNRISWDLTTLTLAAIYYHPELDIARARLALSRARLITAGQRPNPTLSFAAIVNSAAVAGAITPGAIPLTIGPVINLIVETFGKRESRIGQASHITEAARWDLATAGWQVRAAVRGALLDLWAARQRIALTRQRLDREEELVRLLERRREVGEASSLDASRERITRAQIAVDLRGFERGAAAAEARLVTAVGLPVRALAGAALSLDAFERVTPLPGEIAGDQLRRRALNGRTDIEAALAEYEAAQVQPEPDARPPGLSPEPGRDRRSPCQARAGGGALHRASGRDHRGDRRGAGGLRGGNARAGHRRGAAGRCATPRRPGRGVIPRRPGRPADPGVGGPRNRGDPRRAV